MSSSRPPQRPRPAPPPPVVVFMPISAGNEDMDVEGGGAGDESDGGSDSDGSWGRRPMNPMAQTLETGEGASPLYRRRAVSPKRRRDEVDDEECVRQRSDSFDSAGTWQSSPTLSSCSSTGVSPIAFSLLNTMLGDGAGGGASSGVPARSGGPAPIMTQQHLKENLQRLKHVRKVKPKHSPTHEEAKAMATFVRRVPTTARLRALHPRQPTLQQQQKRPAPAQDAILVVSPTPPLQQQQADGDVDGMDFD